MKRRRLELPRHNCHYPLKVARLPIPPPLQMFVFNLWCPEQDSNLHVVKHTHLKRARLPIPPPGLVLSKKHWIVQKDERQTGLGPATSTLARSRSTNWAIAAYFSVLRSIPLNASAKVQLFSQPANFWTLFFQKNFIFLFSHYYI